MVHASVTITRRASAMGRAMRNVLTPLVCALVTTIACSRSANEETNDRGAALRSTTTAPTRVGSCDRVSSTGTCSEYVGSYLAQNEILLTSSCGKLGGTFVYAECPNTSGVGDCVLSTGEIRKFYGTGPSAYEAERALAECEKSFHGTWKGR